MPNHDYRTCSEKDCDECQELIDLGTHHVLRFL